MGNEAVKPSGAPQGWHLKPIYVHTDGKVYRKGVYYPDETAESVEAELKESEKKPPAENKKNEENTKDKVLDSLLEQNKVLVDILGKISQNDKGSYAKEIAEALANSNTQGRTSRRSERKLEEIDNDDILEVPIVFTAHSKGLVVVDYYGANGQVVIPPYGGIFEFKHAATKKIRSDGEEQVHSICQCAVRSKREAEFIRNHPLYEVGIFENSTTPLSLDGSTVQRAVEIWNKVSSWDKAQVIETAKLRPDMKDKMGLEIFRLRKALALSMATQAMNENKEVDMRKAKGMMIESMMRS